MSDTPYLPADNFPACDCGTTNIHYADCAYAVAVNKPSTGCAIRTMLHGKTEVAIPGQMIMLDGPPTANVLERHETINDDPAAVGTKAPVLAGASTKDMRHPRKYRISYIYNPKKLNFTDDVIASEIKLSENWVTFVNDKGVILAAFKAELIQRVERIWVE